MTTPVDHNVVVLFEASLRGFATARDAVLASPSVVANLTRLLAAVDAVIAAGLALLGALRGL